jgi:predicted ABC-type ATPase
VLYVLAGVNGGGKSSIGGRILREAGMDWFNPDDWSRALQAAGRSRESADADAWQEGQRRLKAAIAAGESFAFETTLGGRSVTALLIEATRTHEVLIWYVGLNSPERHIERVALRVRHGGHSIPDQRIRERYVSSMANLVRLVPCVAAIQVFDNSVSVPEGEVLKPPKLVAMIESGHLRWPSVEALRDVPRWAVPMVEAGLRQREP